MDALDKARILRIEAEDDTNDTRILLTKKPDFMFDSEYEQRIIAMGEQVIGKIAMFCAKGDVNMAKKIATTMGEESSSVIEKTMLNAIMNWKDD